ncbi:hypothetical protein BB561_003269 [Smittium simulii]|uniref:2-isopropylmalate synthase n=1 Tax=Smittium simulii TaxID=133385 RepID=A0A2T9YM92_9FUNG|nr:hypothetical protein BB561_003269 [Smittium simulii]
MYKKNKLIIFDTTLRDGEQSPGVTLSVDEKVVIAKQLSRLGVDVVEAGFPVASPGDFLAVQKIAQEVGHLMEGREKVGKPITVCGFSRAVPKDIEATFQAIKDAPCHMIHTALATSDIHLKYKLNMSRDQCIERAVSAVKLAKSFCKDVEFSPEDGARSDPEFLIEVLSKVIAAGATVVNVADTVGYKTPREFGNLVAYLIEHVKDSDKVMWSVHCHNDLGLATANTLAGITNGALQVEVTMNGIGERAGNTSLEEVIMNIQTRSLEYPVYHTINTKLLVPTSKMVSDLTGMAVQPNKAIVGRNAFLHESGIHQDGVLKNKETYEIIRPEDVGVYTSNILLGKHSGRHAIKTRLEEIGYGGNSLTDDQMNNVFSRFKNLADSKKSAVTDDDLLAIISDLFSRAHTSSSYNSKTESSTSAKSNGEISHIKAYYELVHLQVVSGTGISATATITLKENSSGSILTDAALAQTGPVEAAFNAIKLITKQDISLTMYNITATGYGADSACKATVKIKENKQSQEHSVFTGVAAETDIVTASAIAYIYSINKMLAQKYDASESRSSLQD